MQEIYDDGVGARPFATGAAIGAVFSTGFMAGKSRTSLMSNRVVPLAFLGDLCEEEAHTLGISEKHDEAVDAEAPSACRGETVLEPV